MIITETSCSTAFRTAIAFDKDGTIQFVLAGLDTTDNSIRQLPFCEDQTDHNAVLGDNERDKYYYGANYTDKLEEFHSVSDPTADYGIEVRNDYPTEPPYYADQFDAYYVAYGRPQCFFTSNYGEYVQERYAVRNIQLTEEQLSDFIESSRIAYAAVVGPHGFVCPSSVSGTASLPANNEAGRTTDLSYYTELALQYTLEEVTHYWGNYPKVMQKYNIIRDIIVNDMGVDLE